MQVLLPPGWSRPKGFSHGTLAEGKQLFVAGQIGKDEAGELAEGGFAGQVRQALENIVAVLKEGGAGPEHITKMTWFVTDLSAYRHAGKEIGLAYSEVIGRNFPAMTLVEVSGLIVDGAQVEIEANAVIP